MLSIAERLYERSMTKRRAHWMALPVHRVAGCAVVSVGNITVGGTGKTPAVQYIARHLMARGCKVAIVSRGYRGRLSQSGAVVSDGKTVFLDARDAGDEPLLHARALAGVPVVIGRDRVVAAERARSEFGAEAVVLDDAFQFWSLARDLDIALLDAAHPFDNGHLLPRGRLRERPEALARAGAVLLTRCDRAEPDRIFAVREALREYTQAPVFETRHAPVSLVSETNEPASLELLRGASIGALSALAGNAGFASTLNDLGATVVAHARRSDHHYWRRHEVEGAIREAARRGAHFVVTSEKDMVKLPPGPYALPLYALRIELAFLSAEVEFGALLDAAAGAVSR